MTANVLLQIGIYLAALLLMRSLFLRNSKRGGRDNK